MRHNIRTLLPLTIMQMHLRSMYGTNRDELMTLGYLAVGGALAVIATLATVLYAATL